jgi:hypothetical protein
MSNYKPEFDKHGVGWCSKKCPKRCEVLGFVPDRICEPWARSAALAMKATEIIQHNGNAAVLADCVGGWWTAIVNGRSGEGDTFAEALLNAQEEPTP